MDSATILLWATASTTVRAPFTTSPEQRCRDGWYDRFHLHQRPCISSQSLSGVDNPVLWTLTDGNNHAVSGVKGFASGNFGETAFFILGHILKDYSFICDFHRSLVVFKLNSLQLGIAEFMVLAATFFVMEKQVR